jgi:phytoene dehydrogenase-like protein
MYLGVTPADDAVLVRRELEALVDAVQPGWRDAAVHTRFLPHLRVAHDLPTPDARGLRGRPGPRVPDWPGLYVAGDWVGPAGLLADASLASAQAAADAVLTDTAASHAA